MVQKQPSILIVINQDRLLKMIFFSFYSYKWIYIWFLNQIIKYLYL